MALIKDKVYKLRSILETEGFEAGAKFIDPSTTDYNATLTNLLHFWLAKNKFANAAILLWGPNKFTPEPILVQETWESINLDSQLIVIGAGSVGKSYNFAIWTLLDWIMDPDYTFIQCLSVTKAHAKTNVFAHIKDLHQSAIIPLPGEVKGESIAPPNGSDKAGILLKAIPQGDQGFGKLRGFHPSPRSTPHPTFGRLSRLRLLLDEAEEIPIGIWEGVQNMLASEAENPEYSGQVKIFAATNPKDKMSELGKRCEPVEGWALIKPDVNHRWKSKRGWTVQRLDALRSENVTTGEVVYPGMQTKKGFMSYAMLGEDNPEYWCVDDQTEVLSCKGWVNYTNLKVGNKIWTVDIETRVAEWQPVLEVFAKPFKGKLLSFEGRGFSALTTANHKWPITNKGRLLASNYLTLREGKDLTPHDYISLATPAGDNPSSYSEDFAELAGWLLSDGTMPNAKKYGIRVTIAQSTKVNAFKCNLIHNLLLKFNQKGLSYIAKDGMAIFYVTGNLAKALRKACPNKKLTMQFISELSLRGRQALLKGLTLGDGGKTGVGTFYVCTNDAQQAGLFSALMSTVGLANTTHKRLIPSGGLGANKGYNYPDHVMYYVHSRTSKFTKPTSWKITNQPYSGIVWCPTTKNQTFLARRNGGVYYTGNTMARGWFPEQGVFGTAIPEYLLDSNIGTWIFTGSVTNAAGIDLAFAENGDSVQFSYFRFGIVEAWKTEAGEIIKLKSPILGIQFDDIFPLEKQKTLEQTQTIKSLCQTLNILPKYCAVDSTGIGKGVSDALNSTWGNSLGVDYSTKSTETRVLEDDQLLASDMYDGIVTELVLSVRRILEAGYLKLSPKIRECGLYGELSTRKFYQKGQGRVRVEPKSEFKARGNKSPDKMDSFTLGLHAIRQSAYDFNPHLVTEKQTFQDPLPEKSWIDDSVNLNFEED